MINNIRIQHFVNKHRSKIDIYISLQTHYNYYQKISCKKMYVTYFTIIDKSIMKKIVIYDNKLI